MEIITSTMPEVKMLKPIVFEDYRGWFMESYNQEKFKEIGITNQFIQDNQSFSIEKGTLRGLHYQLNPKPQAKLVRCTKGAIFDVAVDIRKGSPTFGQWVGYELTAQNKNQLFIPRGFAHGFITLENNTEVQYKVDNLYSPECDRGIRWDDPTIAVRWPLDIDPILSKKDTEAPLLNEAENNFTYVE